MIGVAKLKRNLTRRDKKTGKDFFRFDVTIPTDQIKLLDWGGGIELDLSIDDDSLSLTTKKTRKKKKVSKKK